MEECQLEDELRACDFCAHYAFNGDEDGAYTGDGRCEHPEHPRAREPEDVPCGNYRCRTCDPVAA